MKLGIGTYTFGWAVGAASPGFDELELLDYAAREGLKVVQIGDNLPLDSFDKDRLAQLAELAEARNLTLEVGARRLTCERVQRYAEIAHSLKARLIRFIIDDVDYRPSAAAVTALLQEAAPILNGFDFGNRESRPVFCADLAQQYRRRGKRPDWGVP